jgi:hypothetical protein
LRKQSVREIGEELHIDGGVDAMKNIFYPIEFRIKEEIGQDAKPFRSWWNDITKEWRY